MIAVLYGVLALLAFNTLVLCLFVLPQMYHELKRRREIKRLEKAYYEEEYATDSQGNDGRR